jgi:hypothetical protein
VRNPIETPPPYAFAPLDVLLAGDNDPELMLVLNDNAKQRANVLLETVKLLLLTMVVPMNVLGPPLQMKAPNSIEMPPPYTFVPLEMLLAGE